MSKIANFPKYNPYAGWKQSPKFTPPAPKSRPEASTKPNIKVNQLLLTLLEHKRPTGDPQVAVSFMVALFKALNISYKKDKHDNFIVEIGQSQTCFTSHTDTVEKGKGIKELEQINGYLVTKGGGVLGADDGAGIYIMLQMIRHKVPGYYVFFAEEEKGRVGSSKFTMPAHIERCISFDRKGTDSIITMQSGEQCCSNEFADAFIAKFQLPFQKDPTGSFTDSYTFLDTVPECTNLSVGYYSQHTQDECQDIQFLYDMVEACIVMDWDDLPTVRDPQADSYGFSYTKDDWGYRFPYVDLADYVYENPDIASAYMEEYGITLDDLLKYEKQIEVK